MELRHLRYFAGVAETENVSRAAARLHVSQPALSKQIRDLEDEIGFSLFERTAKSIRLTPAGRAFLKDARTLLRSAERAVQKARNIAFAGETELHIGYQPTPTARILPIIFRHCQGSIPEVHIKLHDLTNEEAINRLRDGRLQLAFLVRLNRPSSALRNLEFEDLIWSIPRLAVAHTHPFAKRDSVSLQEAARESFVSYSREAVPGYYEFLKSTFAPVRTKLRIVQEHEGVASFLPAVEAGTGVALVPDFFADIAAGRVKLVRVIPEPETTIVSIAALKGKLTPAAETFWRCAKASVTSKKEE
jgi:DNA-binding transcriptional LysR family regulator